MNVRNNYVQNWYLSGMTNRLIACPHWRQKLPKTATNCSRSYRLQSPKTATKVARDGDKLSPVWTGFKGTRAKTRDKRKQLNCTAIFAINDRTLRSFANCSIWINHSPSSTNDNLNELRRSHYRRWCMVHAVTSLEWNCRSSTSDKKWLSVMMTIAHMGRRSIMVSCQMSIRSFTQSIHHSINWAADIVVSQRRWHLFVINKR